MNMEGANHLPAPALDILLSTRSQAAFPLPTSHPPDFFFPQCAMPYALCRFFRLLPLTLHPISFTTDRTPCAEYRKPVFRFPNAECRTPAVSTRNPKAEHRKPNTENLFRATRNPFSGAGKP